MSWLFGGGSKMPGGLPPPIPLPPDDAGKSGSGDDKSDKKTQGYSHFDSAALERAAKAAKDLENNRHAKQILDLQMEQVRKEQLETVKNTEETKTRFLEYQGQLKQQEFENKRVLAKEEVEHHKAKALMEDQLARKRYEDQLAKQMAMNEENRRREEASVEKQMQIRHAAMAQELETDKKRFEAQEQAKAMAKAKADRENRDVLLEQLRAQAAEDRKTKLDAIQSYGSLMSAAYARFTENWDSVLKVAGGLTLLAAGVYTAKGATTVGTKYVLARIQKPSLVRETSRLTLTDIIKNPLQVIRRYRANPVDALEGVVLEPKLEEHVRDIAISTKNIRKNKSAYPTVLMHGPPGTGKTLFAKCLAYHSGMDYALMTGSDMTPMGEHGVTAINKLFDWAETSVRSRGLLLFVDEADAFFHKRKTEAVSEQLRSMINAFLARSSKESNRVMVVLTSNIPEQFDWAMHSRLSEIVHFKLPGIEERERLIRLYFNRYVLEPAKRGNDLKVENFDYNDFCRQVASMTDSFSGREIDQLGYSWQRAAYADEHCTLTQKKAWERVHHAIAQIATKRHWMSKEEKQDLPAYKPLNEKVVPSAKNDA